MLNNIIKSDTKALGKVFGEKEFLRSKEGCLVNLTSKTYYDEHIYLDGHTEIEKINAVVALSEEIIPDNVSLNVFTFIYEKDPLILPILLKYFTHKNLLQKVRDDLDKINQNLQMRKTDIDKHLEEKEIINPIIEIVEKELIAYIRDNKDYIEKIYQSLNNKAKKIIISRNIKIALQISSLLVFSVALMPFVSLFAQTCAGPVQFQRNMFYFFMHYSLPILLPTVAALLALANVVYLVQRYYEQSFAKEMQDFIKGPKHVDKATNTENEKELEQTEKEQDVEDLIDLSDSGQLLTPSAPPLEEKVKERMYPTFDLQKELDSIEVTSFTLPNTDLTQKK
ncbi:hypothetical protein Wcon_02231 [Wolbachia endosymbiont of Cylisticus convexus]|uniref:hypothetical protein n=1 Tax=Wolbachia endosymbiont of Cylisticus convexus TaxID=118728 RepID=UPI000DF71151|nr:hypothetical protein [Wolbachia endosymbiont of Cylisticus convexus]RDD33754.1 hypothetical protein Wcon_02231 [Wolbachia endosymbiont of Cylisticus convexus]